MRYNPPTNVELNKDAIMDRIKTARLMHDLSYRELEQLTGISKSALYKMETDLSDNVPIIYLMSVAKALKIDFLRLIDYKK